MPVCPICKRELGDVNVDKHHLVPRTFKGKSDDNNLVLLHRVCHRKLHATFTERELANYYFTIDRILENETMLNFVRWVSKKPNDYYSGSDETNERYKKRRR